MVGPLEVCQTKCALTPVVGSKESCPSHSAIGLLDIACNEFIILF
jgi:hypothetical protein